MVDADTVAAGSDTVRHDDPKVEALISRANQHVADVTNKLCTLCPPRDEKRLFVQNWKKIV